MMRSVALFGRIFILIVLFSISPASALARQCDSSVVVQVLGSGGPEINDGRASSSYLIWHKNQAKILLDVGSGSSFQFDLAKADFAHLDAILLSHLHTDHSADLPAFIKGSFFTSRDRDLKLFGPTGNSLMPATTEFVQRLFGEQGAFAYLSDYLHKGRESYQLIPFDISTELQEKPVSFAFQWGRVMSIPVHHGPNPALAWRVEIDDCSIIYTGDMSNQTDHLAAFANDADLIIAHMAIPDSAGSVAKNLHMPPKEIARILKLAKPKKVLLSHFMRRSEAQLNKHIQILQQHYGGEIQIAKEQLLLPAQTSD